MIRVQSTLGTTEPNPAYGGIRLTREILESMASQLNSGTVPARLFHDATQPLHIENVEAKVGMLPNGEYVLLIEFDVEEEGWNKYLAERDKLGAPGGLSFAIAEPFGEIEGQDESASVKVMVAADAHHYSDHDIIEAARELSAAGPVTVSRYFQFSTIPAAVVLVQFSLQELAQIPPGVFSAWLYDALRRFGLGREGAPNIVLKVREDASGRETSASIPVVTDETIARRAIEAFEAVANQPGEYKFTPDGGWQSIRQLED